MAYKRIGAVTGANKGIGLATVRQLALQYPKSPMKDGPLLIYLTARNRARGEQALKLLHNDRQLKEAKALRSDGGITDIIFHELDISQTKSIQEFTAFLKKEHPSGIDFVINNAGIALQGFDAEVVKKTLQCNYYGTLEATLDFLSIVRDGGRVVNVSSTAGMLHQFSPSLQEKFRTAKTHPEITALIESFQSAVASANVQQQGWPRAAYGTSKAGVTAMTRCIAEEWRSKGSKTLINACCPGYVRTDMTGGRGVKTPDQGAQTPVTLALADLNGMTGLFWKDDKIIDP